MAITIRSSRLWPRPATVSGRVSILPLKKAMLVPRWPRPYLVPRRAQLTVVASSGPVTIRRRQSIPQRQLALPTAGAIVCPLGRGRVTVVAAVPVTAVATRPQCAWPRPRASSRRPDLLPLLPVLYLTELASERPRIACCAALRRSARLTAIVAEAVDRHQREGSWSPRARPRARPSGQGWLRARGPVVTAKTT